jgi:leucyl/phenylalanyl-tRNA--protein transferase
VKRAVIPVEGFRLSRSLRRSQRRYRLTLDIAFPQVVAACADRPDVWIDEAMAAAYVRLHQLGWAHSIEAWDEGDGLAGGLYGVTIGSLFAGESMFHRERDASKVALAGLVQVMSGVEAPLLDVQWATPHLTSLGAEVIGRAGYLERLAAAIAAPDPFAGSTPDPFVEN